MSEMLPGGAPLMDYIDAAERLPAEEFVAQRGTWFLVIAGGGLARPMPMQRTQSWDQPVTATAKTGFFVVPLRARGAGVKTIAIGRASSNDVVLFDSTISKVHAFFHESPGGLGVSDAGSHNGTFVENKQVPQRGEGEPSPITSGQTLRVGSVSLTLLGAQDLIELARGAPKR